MTGKRKDGAKLEIRKLPINKIAPAPYNPREISDEALEGLTASIREFGLVEPLVWNKRTKRLVAGHQRLKALQRLGATEVEVVVVDLPESREKALNVALNSRAIQGEWTADIEAILAELKTEEPELSGELLFDELWDQELKNLVEKLKFKEELKAKGEKQAKLGQLPPEEMPDEWSVAEITNERGVQSGDIWKLGNHQLYCVDALEIDVPGNTAWIFADPPYRASYAEAKPKRGCKIWPQFIDWKDREEQKFAVWLSTVLGNGIKAAVWMPIPQLFRISCDLKDVAKCIDGIVWIKPRPVISRNRPFLTQREICHLLLPKTATIEGLRQKIGLASDVVWAEYDIADKERIHPTQKPVSLYVYLLEVLTRPGDKIYDPFAGSGSSLIACERTSRIWYGCEIVPEFCSAIIERWEKETGKKAERIKAGSQG